MNTVQNPSSVITLNQRLFQRVFSWMCAGLLMTGLIAYVLSQNENVVNMLMRNPTWFWGIVIAEILIVFTINMAINKISSSTATLLFFLYSALNGVFFTVLAKLFTQSTVYTAFLLTSALFGSFALFGYFTKRDLSKLGSIAYMLLWGVIAATVINIFIGSSITHLIISYVVVGLGCIITAFDIQNIKIMAQSAYDEESMSKVALIGALNLYINFIMIFTNLLDILRND